MNFVSALVPLTVWTWKSILMCISLKSLVRSERFVEATRPRTLFGSSAKVSAICTLLNIAGARIEYQAFDFHLSLTLRAVVRARALAIARTPQLRLATTREGAMGKFGGRGVPYMKTCEPSLGPAPPRDREG